MEIGTEAAQFPEKEHINGIFVAVFMIRYSLGQMYFLCSQSPASSFRHINMKNLAQTAKSQSGTGAFPVPDGISFIQYRTGSGIGTSACSTTQLSRVQPSSVGCSVSQGIVAQKGAVAHKCTSLFIRLQRSLLGCSVAPESAA